MRRCEARRCGDWRFWTGFVLALRTAVLHRNAESFCPGNTPWIVRVLPVVTWTAGRHPARTALTRFIPPERRRGARRLRLLLHGFIVTDDGQWVVVQQGMNGERRQARRYHWLSEGLKIFVE